jgi:hypothetical protein
MGELTSWHGKMKTEKEGDGLPVITLNILLKMN